MVLSSPSPFITPVSIPEASPLSHEVVLLVLGLIGIVVVGGLALLIILRGGKAKGEVAGQKFEVDTGGGSMNGLCPEDDEKMDDAVDLFIKKSYDLKFKIMTAHKRALADYYDVFTDLIDSQLNVEKNFLIAELLWRHFCDPFITAAEENHILDFVDLSHNSVDEVYLNSKVSFLEGRYTKLSRFSDLPPWRNIVMLLKKLSHEVIMEFARITFSELQDLRNDKSMVIKLSAGNPRLERRVKNVSSDWKL